MKILINKADEIEQITKLAKKHNVSYEDVVQRLTDYLAPGLTESLEWIDRTYKENLSVS